MFLNKSRSGSAGAVVLHFYPFYFPIGILKLKTFNNPKFYHFVTFDSSNKQPQKTAAKTAQTYAKEITFKSIF